MVLPAGLADEWAADVIAALGVPTVAVELDGPDRATAAERLGAAGTAFAGVLSLLALDESPSGTSWTASPPGSPPPTPCSPRWARPASTRRSGC